VRQLRQLYGPEPYRPISPDLRAGEREISDDGAITWNNVVIEVLRFPFVVTVIGVVLTAVLRLLF